MGAVVVKDEFCLAGWLIAMEASLIMSASQHLTLTSTDSDNNAYGKTLSAQKDLAWRLNPLSYSRITIYSLLSVRIRGTCCQC